jgi:hypothetical protein
MSLNDYFVRNNRALALSGREILGNAIGGIILGVVVSQITWRDAKKRAQTSES